VASDVICYENKRPSDNSEFYVEDQLKNDGFHSTVSNLGTAGE
jgi:hypothetical protein